MTYFLVDFQSGFLSIHCSDIFLLGPSGKLVRLKWISVEPNFEIAVCFNHYNQVSAKAVYIV